MYIEVFLKFEVGGQFHRGGSDLVGVLIDSQFVGLVIRQYFNYSSQDVLVLYLF